jgi:glycerol-3-phosphate acyltransferase PlsX
MESFRIALDCMGGDYAPDEIVKGGILALDELNCEVLFVGKEELIRQVLKKYKLREDIKIINSEDSIEMNSSPSSVLKRKNSSLYIAGKLLKENQADALVSAGNTGAVLAIGKFVVGSSEFLERPAIAVALPNKLGKKTVLVDVGANVDSRPRHLLDFAIIGHTYAEEMLGVKNPTIGILSIGEEEGKGNELVKETFPLLKETKLNFKGNAEGRDIYNGTFDVIVCDGFVGNIVLKASESLGMALIDMIKEEVMKRKISKLGAFLMKPAINAFKKKVDFEEYGGTPLLGAKKPVIITHGRANAKAIKNAIKIARAFLSHHFNERMKENFVKYIEPVLKEQ